MIAAPWRHRLLFRQLVRREFQERYRGSLLGVLWAVVNPLLMLLVFAFVFSVVLQVRWGTGQGDSNVEFTILLFCGLVIYNFFSECVIRAPGLVLGRVNYVKRVVFPLELLPLVAVASALVNMAICFAILVVANGLLNATWHWTALLAPVLVMPLALMVVGMTAFLASIGVYLRDTSQLVTPLVQLMLFLSPVFYPVSALPELLQDWIYLNPLAFEIEALRQLVVDGIVFDWKIWTIYCLSAVAVAWSGWTWFHYTRHGFADVI